MSKDKIVVGGRSVFFDSKQVREREKKARKNDRTMRRQLKQEGFVPDAVPGISDNDNWLFDRLQSEQGQEVLKSVPPSSEGWLFDVPSKN